ncbi:MAG: hypothetical protein KDA55_16745, partial [Planctomycetales bacterium]|nr:hypothetical protein [Planctomycetales bacterium]
AKTRKRWLKRLGYLLFLLVCVEVGLQVFYRLTTGAFLFYRAALPIFTTDEYRGWAVKPNLAYTHTTNEFSVQLHTNRAGMRVSSHGEEFAFTKDPSKYRIMLLGPSFAFGWAADFKDCFAAQLESMLESAGFADGKDIELLNAGVPSLPPANNLNWYKHVGRQYQPDLIIQLIHGSMAVPNRVSLDYTADRSGYLVPTHPSKTTRVKRVAKQFALVFYAWTVYAKLQGAMTPHDSPSPSPAGSIQGAIPADAFDPAHPMVREAIGFFDDLRAAAVASGAQLRVVYFPPAYGVHREDVNRWIHDGVWDIDLQSAFNQAFCEYLDSRDIVCVNIHHALVAEARRRSDRLYYWLDTHWTPAGNRVAARAVADALLKRPPDSISPSKPVSRRSAD